jgi:anti-sigma regulatory factor (Ser/Thr protein kinase)
VTKREWWLPAVPQSARSARAIVREAAAERGLDDEAGWALMLATSEAVANAVKHGEPCGEGAEIRLRVMACADGLCVEVSDCGSFDGRARPMPELATSGRGLPIISTVTDLFELVPDPCRTRVRFGKRGHAAAA